LKNFVMTPSHNQIYERASCYGIAFSFRDVASTTEPGFAQ